jgi:hypothetical protein
VTNVRTVIHDRRIEIPAPDDLTDGTEVILTIGTDVVDDDGPMSPAEITRVLAAAGRLQGHKGGHSALNDRTAIIGPYRISAMSPFFAEGDQVASRCQPWSLQAMQRADRP